MKKNRLAITVGAAIFISLLLVLSVFSQEDMTHVKDSAFQNHLRKSVPFAHDEHNEKAGIEDCEGCHHSYDEKGNRLEGESSEGTECSECHTLTGKNPIPLASYFHLQCKGCHLEKNKGPVTCGQCHVE